MCVCQDEAARGDGERVPGVHELWKGKEAGRAEGGESLLL